MPMAIRPSLQPSHHRRLSLETRRPWCCLVLTSGVLALLFAVFAVSGWNLYSHQFNPLDHRYHDGDQVALAEASRDFSSLFCDAYNVTLMDHGKVYLLPRPASVNQSESFVETFVMHRTAGHDLTIREFYLLKGSDLVITACRVNGSKFIDAQILVIKGTAHLDKWRHDQFCKDCFFRTFDIPRGAVCAESVVDAANDEDDDEAKDRRATSNFNVSIPERDHYALIASYGHTHHNPHHKRHRPEVIDDVIINVTLTRTVFDLQNYEQECEFSVLKTNENQNQSGSSTSKECEFDLAWHSPNDVIIDFGMDVRHDYDGYTDSSRRFRTRCHPRVSFWILIFAGVPAVLAIPIAMAFAWFLCRRRKHMGQVKRLSSQSEVKVRDDASLVHNDVMAVHRMDEDSCMAIQDD